MKWLHSQTMDKHWCLECNHERLLGTLAIRLFIFLSSCRLFFCFFSFKFSFSLSKYRNYTQRFHLHGIHYNNRIETLTPCVYFISLELTNLLLHFFNDSYQMLCWLSTLHALSSRSLASFVWIGWCRLAENPLRSSFFHTRKWKLM